MPNETPTLDLRHLQRVAAILDGIPADCDLPHALVALEDAFAVLGLALSLNLSLAHARKLNREEITRAETRQVLREHGRLPTSTRQ